MSEITEKIKLELRHRANPEKAKLLQRFFKTGAGQYGAGDVFWGIIMPDNRVVAGKFFRSAELSDVEILLHDPVHEVRMTALLILNCQYLKADAEKQRQIFEFYLKNAKYINNWDLVDVTCKGIVGAYLFKGDRRVLYSLAKSKNLWEKRIAIISTAYFIGRNDFKDTIALSEILLRDEHDLMHKAVGWMLREVYKRDPKLIIDFLEKYRGIMPRTTLRYTIEKMPPSQRSYFLSK